MGSGIIVCCDGRGQHEAVRSPALARCEDALLTGADDARHLHRGARQHPRHSLLPPAGDAPRAAGRGDRRAGRVRRSLPLPATWTPRSSGCSSRWTGSSQGDRAGGCTSCSPARVPVEISSAVGAPGRSCWWKPAAWRFAGRWKSSKSPPGKARGRIRPARTRGADGNARRKLERSSPCCASSWSASSRPRSLPKILAEDRGMPQWHPLSPSRCGGSSRSGAGFPPLRGSTSSRPAAGPKPRRAPARRQSAAPARTPVLRCRPR